MADGTGSGDQAHQRGMIGCPGQPRVHNLIS